MNVFSLPVKSLLNRRSTFLLSVFSIALSSFLLLAIERLKDSAEDSFRGTISETDLIVGARSGQLQLLLYSIFHIGSPVANVSWKAYEEISSKPDVKWSIPISLGDSHRGFRVVGTDDSFYRHFRYRNSKSLDLTEGDWKLGVFNTVLGSEVAKKFQYSIGDKIILSHGVGEILFQEHSDKAFTVQGVLQPTGTSVDRSLYVSLEGIEAIHIDWTDGAPPREEDQIPADEISEEDLKPQQITAFLVGLNSKIGIFQFQREINSYSSEALMAILPAVSLQELWDNLFTVERLLQLVSACVAVVAILGMLMILLTSLNERRREMAILRSVGAPPAYIFLILVLEASIISFLGICLGVVLLHISIFFGGESLENAYGVFVNHRLLSSTELGVLMLLLFGGTCVGLIPAWKAYRNSLTDGLRIRI